MFLGGGSDDAGFVQVIQGKLTDPERFRTFMAQPMDALHEARPEILGGTIAIEPDGTFTQTVAFTTEAAAREGEAKEMPEDMRERRGGVLGDAGRHLPRPAPPVVRLEELGSRDGLRTRAETLTEGVRRGRLSRSRSAFQRVSAHSSSTSERTVMPPPVPSHHVPSGAAYSDRITTPRSARPSAQIQPNAPA